MSDEDDSGAVLGPTFLQGKIEGKYLADTPEGTRYIKPSIEKIREHLPWLAEREQWIVWSWDGSQKKPHRGDSPRKKTGWQEPGNQVPLGQAWTAYEEHEHLGGIGFVFTGEESEILEDFDNCINTWTYNIKHDCLEDALENDDEPAFFSTSGTGAHRYPVAPDAETTSKHPHEVYSSGRFAAVTGHKITEEATAHGDDLSARVNELSEKYNKSTPTADFREFDFDADPAEIDETVPVPDKISKAFDGDVPRCVSALVYVLGTHDPLDDDGPGWGQNTFGRYSHLLMLLAAHLGVNPPGLADLAGSFKSPVIAAAQNGEHFKKPAMPTPHGKGVPWDLPEQAGYISAKVAAGDLSPPNLETIEDHCNIKVGECSCSIHKPSAPAEPGGREPVAPKQFGPLNEHNHRNLKNKIQNRGYSWPSDPAVSNRIHDKLVGGLKNKQNLVLQAPTASNKTGAAAETVYTELDSEVTGDRPVVMFCETIKAREEVRHRAETAGLDVWGIRGRKELCPVCAGKYDPGGKYVEPDDPSSPDSVELDGEPISRWIDERCDRRGLPISVVHAAAKRRLEQAGRSLPCSDGQECAIQSRWPTDGFVKETNERCAVARHTVIECDDCTDCGDRCDLHDLDHTVGDCDKCRTVREARFDLIVATDQFAYVPSLRKETNVIMDEQPSYREDFGIPRDRFHSGHEHMKAVSSRVQDAVTAFLEKADVTGAPDTFEELVVLADNLQNNRRDLGDYIQIDNERSPTNTKIAGELETERQVTEEALRHKPDRDWYLNHPDAHTLAPAITRALWDAIRDGFDENNLAPTPQPVTHWSPQLGKPSEERRVFNRSKVTVVIDERFHIRLVRNVPDFATARSVIGLDAHPTDTLWKRNVTPQMEVERVLNPDEAKLWRLFERRQIVVRVGEADRPAGRDGKYFNEKHAQALIEQILEEWGEEFSAIGCPSAFEDELERILIEAGVDEETVSTLHYGEEKSRNPDTFATATSGLVYGCIDPGDDYVLNLLAEAGLDAWPERVDPDELDDSTNAYCDACDGDGCSDCIGTGLKRARGRRFAGPDADHAETLLGSVRETHVAQMVGRFGRNLERGQYNVTLVAGPVPDELVDLQVSDVAWLGEKQAEIISTLADMGRATVKELAEAVDCSKEHVRETLTRLQEQTPPRVIRAEGAGKYGADLWDALSGIEGVSDLGDTAPEERELTLDKIANSDVYYYSTAELAIENIVDSRSNVSVKHV